MSDYEESDRGESSEDDVPRKANKKQAEKTGKVDSSDSEESSVATEDDSIIGNLLGDDSDLEVSDDEEDEEADPGEEKAPDATEKPAKKTRQKQVKEQEEDKSEDEFQFGFESDDEEDLDDDDGEQYLQKLDESVRERTIANHHPELIINNYEEIEALTNIVRDERGVIIDPLHKTLPFLSKYERTRILGERAKQINDGAKTFVPTDPSVIDGYLIALAELEQKKIPFIIRRPLANGASEYWKLKDLEML
jgi:DNA-directed RNA polymerase I, II, and III subunit RPABC2